MTTATTIRRRWTIEFGASPSGRATAFAVNARADDVTSGRASIVEWTNLEGERLYTQPLITSYANEFASELISNNRRGQYADVSVIKLGPLPGFGGAK